MNWLPLSAALLFAAGTGAIQPAPPAPVAELSEAELLELERERFDRLTVPVTIGETGPYRFLVDTGAQATVLSRELADSLGLMDRRPAILVGMASRVATETVSIDGLGLGRRRTSVARAPLVEGRNIGGADGVLGIDALQGQRVLIDFVEQRMTIVPEDSRGSSGYEIVVRARRQHGQLIITHARIDGIRTAVVIDTGAQSSIGNAVLASRLQARGPAKLAQLYHINGMMAEGRIHIVGSAEIDRLELQKLPVVFTPSPVFDALELHDQPALILGIRELRQFRRVAIDFGKRRILFDMPSSVRPLSEEWRRWRES